MAFLEVHCIRLRLISVSTKRKKYSDNRSSNFSENQLRAILNPKNYPLGKFPSETRFHLYLMQQVAVNLSTGYDDSRIRSVNGPPGTGKTTLLKDIFAELIVKQAYEICKLGNDKFVKGNRETIYDHDENGKTKFIGNLSNEIAKYNIVVASSNNSAVQNIVDEIPLVSKIDKNLVNELKAADYFYKLANLDVKVNWEKVIETSWKWINMTIPIISTTFASFWSMFKRLRPDSMGHLFIDEAGQAIPQAAVGAVLRSKYVMAVGDPAQITPVNTLGPKIMNWIGELKAVTEKYVSASASVQSLIDATSKYGYYRDDSDWVGIPLWVHRRCKSPMFDISNKVSYNNLMVQAEPQNGIFGWYDIKGVATDKYVEEQGNKLYELLSEKIKENPKIIDKEEKDVIYVISPFKNVAKNLIEKLEDLEFVRKKDHKVTNIGTIHTFQGKEAPIVYLVLGADEKSIGAARWAVSEPNMINVAASRAKEEFYIIGDIDLYKNLNSRVMNDTLSVIMKYYSDHKDKAILFPVDNAKKDFVIPEYSKSDYNTISGQDTDQNSYRDYSERILLFRTWLEDRGFKVSRQDSNYIISDSNNTAILDDYELLALCKKEEHVDIRVKFAEWLKAHGFFKQTYFPVVCHVAGHLSRDCAVTTDVGEIYPICGSNNGRHLVALNEKGNPDDFMLFDSVWDDPFDTVYYPVDGVAGENDGYQALFCDPRNFIKHSDCDIGKQTFEDAIIFKPGEEKNARLICPMFVSAAGDHYIAIDIDVSEEILKVEPVGEDTYMDIHGNYYKLFSSYLGI